MNNEKENYENERELKEIKKLERELNNLKRYKEHISQKKVLLKEKDLLENELKQELKREKFLQTKKGKILNKIFCFFKILILAFYQVFKGIFDYFKKIKTKRKYK